VKAFAAFAFLALALSAYALGPTQAEVIGSLGPGAGIIELRDSTTRLELLPLALAAFERRPGDVPERLSFRPDPTRFERPSPSALRGFIDAKAVWLCFTIRSAASSRSWLLDTGTNRGDEVSFYVVDPDGSVESQVIEPTTVPPAGTHAPSEYAFRLTVGPGQVKTVYLRFAAEGLLTLRATIWDSFEYIKADEAESCLVGGIFGVIVAVFIYTLFIAISLRQGSYAFYLAYLSGFLVFASAASGAGQAFAWQGWVWIGQRVQLFSMIFMDFGIVLFARAFLGKGSKPGLLSWLLSVVAGLCFVAAAGLAFLDLRFFSLASIGLDLIAKLAVLTFALAASRAPSGQGSRVARFFAASYFLSVAGCVYARLGQAGIILPFNSLWATGEELGALAQVLLLSYGITDAINAMRKEKEEDQLRSIELLERANRVKEDFVIGTSLEFRSPLFGIVGLVDGIDDLAAKRETDGSPGGEASEERRLAALVKAEALRLLGSVANIAAYVRLRNGDLALVAEPVSLRELVDGVAGSASHIAVGKDIAVEKAVEDIEMETDARVLEQVVYNLLADAFKRSASGIMRIEGALEGSANDERVRLSLVDSAPALGSEVLARFRSKGSPSGPEAVGPGLELLVARLLAESLGGSLSYAWSDGRGRFDLELPRERSWRQGGRAAERGGISSFLGRIAARRARPVQADLSETPEGKGSRGLVLAYDEDPVFLEALKRYLEGRGYAVAPTLSADKAVALVSARRFDLVLLDASGQGRPGLAACARIRASAGMDELPIVVMTDRESAEAVEAAFRAGASDYLPKLSPNELLFARVDTLVALRRAVEDALETRKRVADLEKLKTLGVLAAGVAHEVNTPNNAIIRNLPVVSEVWRELAPSLRRLMEESEGFSVRGWSAEELMRELPELLADTYNAGLQIKKIVEDLKDYARDSSTSPPEPVDLSSVAAYAARLLQPLVGRSTRRFELDAPLGLPPVKANFQKLTQVAVSVLENALQSLPGPEAGVWLRTRFDAQRRAVLLECEDEGGGIPSALLDKVFEPFFTTKREAGGTGLGLSVAVGIVRDAGGEIEIESREGRGTSVRVTLPAIEEGEREGDGRSG
jgi:signal transduction histidine kinase